MKHFFAAVIFFAMCNTLGVKAQNTFPASGAAGIGTATPNTSSLLDVTSTSKGVLVPRMTKAQRDAIVSPATGLLIFQTNSTPGFYYYSGTAWTAVSSKGANAALSNLTSPTAVNMSLVANANNTLDLGSSAQGWRNGYFSGSIYLKGQKFIDIGLEADTVVGNTFVGATGNTLNTGYDNSFFGHLAGSSNTSGSSNTAVGESALSSNTTGGTNTAVGQTALQNNTSGSDNTAVGWQALEANTSGYANTAIGRLALQQNTGGAANVAIGNGALMSNSTGYSNTAVGTALLNNTTGNYNSALGLDALHLNTTGSTNSAVGLEALFSNSTASDNNAFGYRALGSTTSGGKNTSMGTWSLSTNTTGDNNTGLGYFADVASTALTNATAIGARAQVGQSNSLVLGSINGVNGATSDVNVGIGTTTPGHALEIKTNSSLSKAQLLLNENDNDYARMRFKNNTGSTYWDIAGYNNATNSSELLNFYNSTTGNIISLYGNGKVGIMGASPSATQVLKVGTSSSNGNGASLTTGGTWTNASDRNLKEDFQALNPSDILNKINQLEITRWKYKGTDNEYHIGPMAQDFYAQFHVGNDDRSISTIDPGGVALLAIQALSKTNDSLQKENENLQTAVNSLQTAITDIQSQLADLKSQQEACCLNAQNNSTLVSTASGNGDAARLDQNIPNPFDQNTTIGFYIPSSAKQALLVITDVNGQILKQYALSRTGVGQVMLSGRELSSGTYNYSLVIDGVRIDTKQMVLTK